MQAPTQTNLLSLPIYHITDVANLPAILAMGSLLSDAGMRGVSHAGIGYGHIKLRRLTQIVVPCCSNRFVGEFVPFYFCPRSPMLFTINKRSTGRPPGCQSDIVHLVSSVGAALGLGRQWAVSDGNASAAHAQFYSQPAAIAGLDWTAIHAHQWSGLTHQKSAELLVADHFPFSGFSMIGCHNKTTESLVQRTLQSFPQFNPLVAVQPQWYY